MNRFWPALMIAILSTGCASPPRDTVGVRSDPAASGPSASPTPSDAQTAAVTIPMASILATAESYIGVPYRYGGHDRSGLDCSGLVVSVYRQHQVRLPRTSDQQFREGEPIAPNAMRAGDLVFFANSQGHVHHVGIYAGKGRFIHASPSRREVRYDLLTRGYFRDRFVGARRVITAAR